MCPDQPLPEGPDDGNAPSHARLEIQIHMFRLRQAENFGAVFSQQGLVCGNDGLSKLQRTKSQIPRERGSTNHFHHDLHGIVLDNRHRIGHQQGRIHRKRALFRRITNRDPANRQLEPGPPGN